jgi:hypothetical protein
MSAQPRLIGAASATGAGSGVVREGFLCPECKEDLHGEEQLLEHMATVRTAPL